MKARLSTTVPVVRFAVFAQMAWLETRPELGLVCQTAWDDECRLTPEVVDAVLPGLSEAGIRNVVRWCHTLGLCDAQGGLTALGSKVAQSHEVPVPEQGVYDVWLVQHPLTGNRLLAVERLASRQDQRFELIEPLEAKPERGVVFQSVLEPGERFLVHDLPANHDQVGIINKPTSARCELHWNLDFEAEHDQWRLEGQLDVSRGTTLIQHEAEHLGFDLWGLAAHWGAGPMASFGRWDPEGRRLALAFEGSTPTEQDQFVKTIQLDQVDVPSRGTYRDVTLKDVPIGPATPADAQRWAMARFERTLEGDPRYRSRGEIRRLFVELSEGTPLERHGPTLPPHDAYIDDGLHDRKPEVFWNLAAPVDLTPRPIEPEDRGELRMEAPAYR